jgi:hypothetical protein
VTFPKLRRLRNLSLLERLLLAQLMVVLPLTGVLLRLVGFVQTFRLLGKTGGDAPASRVDAPTAAEARRTAWLVSVASRHGPYRPRCLARSLVLWWLLQRRGLNCQLRIGVQRSPADFAAHAWVELAGQPLGEPASTSVDYTAFEGIDRLSRA